MTLIAGLQFPNLRSNKSSSNNSVNYSDNLHKTAQSNLEIEINKTIHRTIRRKKNYAALHSFHCPCISKWISIINFNSEKSSTCYIWDLCSVVSQASAILHRQFGPCLVKTYNIAGINREFSQAAFFKMTCQDLKELSAVTGHHQLTMWLALPSIHQSTL